jgi:exopolysaccharide biosynthesis protein
MINLIPQEEKKKMVKGFYYKLIVLFFVVGSFSFFIIFVATVPSLFLSSVKKNIVNTKLEMQTKEPVPLPDQKTLSIIKDLNNKLAIIENAKKNKFVVSEKVINAIILKKIADIEITDISYVNEPLKDPKDPQNAKMGRKISIQGNAPSREVLLLFRRALEGSASFKQVDLPISNFVKGSNIKFYLSLIPS